MHSDSNVKMLDINNSTDYDEESPSLPASRMTAHSSELDFEHLKKQLELEHLEKTQYRR